MASSSSTTSSTWNLNDIYANANNWSLQGDAKLLEFMQTISKNLESRCNGTQTKMNAMLLDLDKTNIRLENTTNKMLSLKNLQFMECRVHDEVDMSTNTMATAGNDPISSMDVNENDEMTTLQAIQMAVGNGLKMMDKCYEKVSLQLDDDSDDDDDDDEQTKKRIIFRAKNPHDIRPLPHIIGSKEWNEKWHIGLIDSDDDDDDDDENANDNELSSDTDSISVTSSVVPAQTESDYSTNASSSTRPEPSTFVRPPPSSHLVSNLFDESESDTERPPPPARVRVLPPQQQPSDATSIFRSQKPPQQSVTVAANLFDNEPPALDAIAVASDQRKPVNLFVDSSDDDQVAAVPVKSISTKPPPQQPIAAPRQSNAKAPNIFDDDSDDDDVVAIAKPSVPVVAPPPATTIRKSNISNLFDDLPPDDLFDVMIKTQMPPTKKNIFDDLDDDFMASSARPTKSTDERKSIVADSVGKLPAKIEEKKRIFDDIDDDFDIAKEVNIFDNDKPNDAKNKKANMFDDDPDDDFDFLSGKQPTRDQSTKASIFDKEKPEIVPPSKVATNIFDDDLDDDLDFLSAKKSSDNKIGHEASIFDDEKPLTTKVKDVNDKKINIFDDDLDDLDFINVGKKSSKISTDEFIGSAHNDQSSKSIVVESPKNIFDQPTITLESTESPPDLSSSSDITKDQTMHKKDNFTAVETKSESKKIVDKESKTPIKNVIEPKKNSFLDNLLDDQPPDDDYEDIFRQPSQVESVATQSDPENQFSFLNDEPPDDASRDIDSDLFTSSSPPDDDDDGFLFPNKATAASSTSIGLFDDLPPDDDFLSNKRPSNQSIFNDDDEDFFPPSIHASTKPSSAGGLFDDLPPPDDGVQSQSSVAVTPKKLFYDDFSETIITAPPPDTVDELDRAEMFKQNRNRFAAQPIQSEAEPTASQPPPPKKLNDNFKINVAALLPGAKMPSFRPPPPPPPTATVDVEGEQQEAVVNVTGSVNNETAAESSSDRLVGFNKNRPKIQQQRRPSTRHARQQQYRKSLVVNSKEDEIDNRPPPTQSIEDMFKNASEDDWLLPPPPGTKSRIESIDGEEDRFVEHVTPAVNKSIAEPPTAGLFSDEDGDDLFTALAKPITKQSAAVISSTAATKKVPSNEHLKTKAAFKPSLFGDDGDDDDDDDLFGHASGIRKQPSAPARKEVLAKAYAGLFGDSDDDDDIFATDVKKVSIPKQRTTANKDTDRKISNVTATLTGDPLTDLLK